MSKTWGLGIVAGAILLALLVGFGLLVNWHTDRVTACEEAGGHWLRGDGGSACYDVERIEP